jgi:hypothetical protein
MSPYSGPFYETIGAEEEMKTLRASPTKGNVGNMSTSDNGNAEPGKKVGKLVEILMPNLELLFCLFDMLKNLNSEEISKIYYDLC